MSHFPQDCLFHDVSHECSAASRYEHIIQEGLAGSLVSRDIICGSCNNYFSRQLDSELTTFYEPVAKTLAPFLPGRSKQKKKRSTIIVEDGTELQVEYSGGVVTLAKRHEIHTPDDKVTLIGKSPDELREIAASRGYKVHAVERRLLTEQFANAAEHGALECNPLLIRSILLDAVEFLRYMSIRDRVTDIAMLPSLRHVRLWVRTGCPSMQFPPKNILYSFAPLQDMIEPLFSPSTFSHKMVMCYDHASEVLILVLQFFDTLPWVFLLDNVSANPASFSVLYKKALVDGADELRCESEAVLDVKAVRWCQFSTATVEARTFAQTKCVQEFQKQQARAQYESDLRNDDFIRARLAGCAERSGNRSVDAVLELMRNRYEGNRHLTDILDVTRKRAESQLRDGPAESQRISVYRDCLREIQHKYGYPEIIQRSLKGT